MEKIINIGQLAIYKEAVELLKSYNITYEKSKLINNPELCLDIINIFQYLEKK